MNDFGRILNYFHSQAFTSLRSFPNTWRDVTYPPSPCHVTHCTKILNPHLKRGILNGRPLYSFIRIFYYERYNYNGVYHFPFLFYLLAIILTQE